MEHVGRVGGLRLEFTCERVNMSARAQFGRDFHSHAAALDGALDGATRQHQIIDSAWVCNLMLVSAQPAVEPRKPCTRSSTDASDQFAQVTIQAGGMGRIPTTVLLRNVDLFAC